jgi:PhnB protein
MTQKVQAIPQGYHTITPHLVFKDGAKAIEFYKKAFGAEELNRMPSPDGKSIWHAEIKIGNSVLFLADEAAGMGARSAETIGGSPISIHLYVENADEVFNRAVSAGATVKMPLTDMFWGDRYAMIADPFGYQWAIAQHIKDLTPEELAKASAEAAKQFAQK